MDKLLVCLPENGAIPLFRNQRIDQRNMRKESTCFEEFFAAFRLAVIRIFYFYSTRSPIVSNVPSTPSTSRRCLPSRIRRPSGTNPDPFLSRWSRFSSRDRWRRMEDVIGDRGAYVNPRTRNDDKKENRTSSIWPLMPMGQTRRTSII